MIEIKKPKGTILIDDDDEGLLDGWSVRIAKYKIQPPGYASLIKKINGKAIYKSLSRIIMSEPIGMEVDHINHNTLDNRKCNLRICTRSENARNNAGQRTRTGSKYKGVTFHDCKKYKPNATGLKPWRAYTRIAGKRIWFGYYITEEDAARVYNENAKRLFGEFAYLNDISDP